MAKKPVTKTVETKKESVGKRAGSTVSKKVDSSVKEEKVLETKWNNGQEVYDWWLER